MAERWSTEPQYSHGFLVPVFALVVLWYRRAQLSAGSPQPSWWGLAWLAIGLGLRLTGAYFYIEALDSLSLVPTLAGICALVWGEATLRWAWPALAFLGFMLPLPHQAEVALALPLRQGATLASTFALQMLGYPAIAEGNVILLGELELGVVEACSGLGMLVTFFALSTAMALIVDRPLLDRLVLVASAVPIALIANVLRIVATAVAHSTWGPEVGRAVMHDLAGWLMMPLALALLGLELLYLRRLLIEEDMSGPVPLSLPAPALPAPPSPSAPGLASLPQEKLLAPVRDDCAAAAGPLPAATIAPAVTLTSR
jgi:exosortase